MVVKSSPDVIVPQQVCVYRKTLLESLSCSHLMYIHMSLCVCEILLIFPFIPSLSSFPPAVLSDLCILPGAFEMTLFPPSPLHILQVPAASPTLLSAAWDSASVSSALAQLL